ncbi:NAD-dependent epimerase/dehydratase family protein [Butyrivibrio sp. AE2032]|uniref:NAD-dependent epimerase/dehydratase family protein n=1 Tax=Butyrivibrio sp. AE2032 TaxID=1458463 RepID=UPI00055667A9|nr:NAD-dependent epimerase/dehydratase family protein [Butyrivibrio sp. AE2032]
MSVKYLVSGAEGALGKTVISMLLQRGEKVRILMSELSDTRMYRNNPNIEICYGISTDKDSMREFFELEDPRSAVLFHTDEYVSLSDETNLTMRRVNVIGAENVVDMCLKRKVGKLVYLSSAYALNPEVKGEDITIHFDRNKVAGEYAKSKAEAAAYVMEKVALNRLNAVMVLPTFIIGPGYSEDYEINKVLNSYLNNGTIPPKEGGRAFVDVRDVANAMLTLADKGEPGAGYIVAGDYKTSGEFFKDVNEISGIDAPVKTASKLVMSKSLAKLVDFYYKITHKENPRQAYTLFSENPDARFESDSNGILPETSISFKDSLNDTIKGAQHGGIQAAAAVQPKSDKKSSDAPQSKSEKKSSAEAMEARLKQQQSVTSKASSASTAPAEAPSRPANTRPATAAAMAAAAAKEAVEEAKKEEVKEEVKEEAENKSIIPQSSLKDPDALMSEPDEEEKLNTETTFRFGGTPAKFTTVQPQNNAPAKSIIPQAKPNDAKPTPFAPKAEPAKSIIPPKEAPKAAEAPKTEEKKEEAPKAAPASSGFPRAAATPSSGFPRAAATPSSGFPRAAATPSSGFPKATATPSAPAAPKADEAPKAEEKKEEAPKAAPASSGFPRAAATPSSGFPRASATPSSGFPRAAATPSSGFPRAAATPSSGLAKPAETLSGTQDSGEEKLQPSNSPFRAAMQPSAAAPAKAPAGGQSINSAFKPVQSTEPSPFKTAQSAEPSPFKSAQPAASAPAKEPAAQPINSAFKSAQSSEPSPFKSAQSADPSPFKSSQASEPSPFKSAQPAVSAAPAAAMKPSNADIDDLEAEIEAFTPSSGPVVPPGIFAPPPKPGN